MQLDADVSAISANQAISWVDPRKDPSGNTLALVQATLGVGLRPAISDAVLAESTLGRTALADFTVS